MGQSLVKNYLHVVFSTKHRQPLITDAVELKLHAYLSGICKSLDSHALKIGGYNDHIHILCTLSKKIALVKLMEEIKSHSSKWMKAPEVGISDFYWQEGYGAFSVNPSEVELVCDYIERQKEHHKTRTFQDEYRAFLQKYGVEYDERYVWD